MYRGAFEHQKVLPGCLPQLMDAKRKRKRNQSVTLNAYTVVIVVTQLETAR